MESEVKLEQRGSLCKLMPLVYALFGVAVVPWLYLVLVLREPFVGLMMTLVIAMLLGGVLLLRLAAQDRPLWQFRSDALVVKARMGITRLPWQSISRIHLRRHALPVAFPAWLEIEGLGLDAPLPLRVAPQEVATIGQLDALLTGLLEWAPARIVEPEVVVFASFIDRTRAAAERGQRSPITHAAERMDCSSVTRAQVDDCAVSSTDEFLRAACLFFSKRYNASLEAVGRTLTEEPSAWDALLCRALCYERLGDLEAAREALDDALGVDGVRFGAVIEAERGRLQVGG